LYIVSCHLEGRPAGFLASFLVQCGFEPPTIVVALGKDRPHLAALRPGELFGVSILDAASRGLMAPFLKSDDPFAGLAAANGPGGSLHLVEALAWLECRVTGEHASGDHVVVFGEVVDGAQKRDGEPAIHLRKNGLGY